MTERRTEEPDTLARGATPPPRVLTAGATPPPRIMMLNTPVPDEKGKTPPPKEVRPQPKKP